MAIELRENCAQDAAAEMAAAGTRAAYCWRVKTGLWIFHIRTAWFIHRKLNRAFREIGQSALPFGYFSRVFRALRCYSSVLDDLAVASWEHTKSLPDDERGLGFHNAYISEHTRHADPELRKRGLIWKDADRDLLLAFYQSFRGVGEQPTDVTPKEWSEISASIHLSRIHVERCTNVVANRTIEGEAWISKHFDLCHFEGCTFRNCDFSNASFASSLFTRCTFSNVLMVNARLTGAAFNECALDNVDFSGAFLQNVRFWYRNHLSGIRIDVFTEVRFPLIEECELSYELAARNYRLLHSWYSDAGLSTRRSDSAYRWQYCLSQSYPFGRERFKLFAYRLLSGYSERPARFSLWLFAAAAGFAAAYKQVGVGTVNSHRTILDALYFSVVTLTTLGYGDIAPTNNPIGQFLAMGEVIIGVVGIAYLTALVIRRLM